MLFCTLVVHEMPFHVYIWSDGSPWPYRGQRSQLQFLWLQMQSFDWQVTVKLDGEVGCWLMQVDLCTTTATTTTTTTTSIQRPFFQDNMAKPAPES